MHNYPPLTHFSSSYHLSLSTPLTLHALFSLSTPPPLPTLIFSLTHSLSTPYPVISLHHMPTILHSSHAYPLHPTTFPLSTPHALHAHPFLTHLRCPFYFPYPPHAFSSFIYPLHPLHPVLAWPCIATSYPFHHKTHFLPPMHGHFNRCIYSSLPPVAILHIHPPCPHVYHHPPHA